MSTRAAFESLGSNQNFERRGFQRWLVEVDTQSARMSFMFFFGGGGAGMMPLELALCAAAAALVK